MLTDLFVIVIYFLAIFCIGIYAGRRQNSLTDYALGNRSLPWWAILASILAAEISAATFLGAPGEGYHTRNFTYAQLCIGTILGRIIVGRLFLKPYYDYKVVSIYEYLEKRFGLLTRRTASMVFLISRVLASGTRLYFAGILLVIAYQFLTGVTADASQIVLLYIAALVAISVATTIYTAIGGLKAVVWTDVLQAVVLGVSMLSALWVLFSHIPGGWSSISAAMNGGDDWKFFSWGTGEGLDFLQQGARVLGQEYTGGLPGSNLHHHGYAWHGPGHGAAHAGGKKQQGGNACSHRIRLAGLPHRHHFPLHGHSSLCLLPIQPGKPPRRHAAAACVSLLHHP